MPCIVIGWKIVIGQKFAAKSIKAPQICSKNRFEHFVKFGQICDLKFITVSFCQYVQLVQKSMHLIALIQLQWLVKKSTHPNHIHPPPHPPPVFPLDY